MSYPSDLNDQQRKLIKEQFEMGNYGKRRNHSQRTRVNAVFYSTAPTMGKRAASFSRTSGSFKSRRGFAAGIHADTAKKRRI